MCRYKKKKSYCCFFFILPFPLSLSPRCLLSISMDQTNTVVKLTRLAKKIRAGFVTTIFQTTSNNNDCIIQIRDLPINRYLTINLNGIQITCNNVMFSNGEQKHSYFFYKTK